MASRLMFPRAPPPALYLDGNPLLLLLLLPCRLRCCWCAGRCLESSKTAVPPAEAVETGGFGVVAGGVAAAAAAAGEGVVEGAGVAGVGVGAGEAEEGGGTIETTCDGWYDTVVPIFSVLVSLSFPVGRLVVAGGGIVRREIACR